MGAPWASPFGRVDAATADDPRNNRDTKRVAVGILVDLNEDQVPQLAQVPVVVEVVAVVPPEGELRAKLMAINAN